MLALGTHQACSAHQGPAHVVGLRAEDVFDPDLHTGFGSAAALRLFGQRFTPLSLAVSVAFQLSVVQLALHLFGVRCPLKIGH